MRDERAERDWEEGGEGLGEGRRDWEEGGEGLSECVWECVSV